METDRLLDEDNWTISNDNVTTNGYEWIEVIENRPLLITLLLCFSMITIFGNVLVIVAVIREKYLHNVTNYFITSLAVADCLVGLVVMPFSAIYQIFDNTWFFGIDVCDLWRSLDVLFSTASILNLCVISLDRYWAITNPFTYPMKMTTKRSVILIALIWLCSCLISFPAILWWRVVRGDQVTEFSCPFTDNLSYLLFSSTISFYLPLTVMVFTYCKIYRAALMQTRSLKTGTKLVMGDTGEPDLTLRIHRGGFISETTTSSSTTEIRPMYLQPMLSSSYDNVCSINRSLTCNNTNHSLRPDHVVQSKNFSISRKLAKFAKEKKAAKTLGIVMGVFIICWLPFFVVNLLSGFCQNCIWEQENISVIVAWLGWINSGMNPAIYAFWSKDFRRAFARILCGCWPRKIKYRHRNRNRNRHYNYQATLRNKPVQVCHHVALQTVMSIL